MNKLFPFIFFIMMLSGIVLAADTPFCYVDTFSNVTPTNYASFWNTTIGNFGQNTNWYISSPSSMNTTGLNYLYFNSTPDSLTNKINVSMKINLSDYAASNDIYLRLHNGASQIYLEAYNGQIKSDQGVIGGINTNAIYDFTIVMNSTGAIYFVNGTQVQIDTTPAFTDATYIDIVVYSPTGRMLSIDDAVINVNDGACNYNQGAIFSLDSVYISPPYPIVMDTLEGYALATNTNSSGDYQNVTYYYEWKKNAVLNTSGNQNALSGYYVNLANISSGNLTAGDNWTFSVRAYNGSYYTAWSNTSVTIFSGSIDNCSNPNGYTSNATAANISFYDDTGNEINVYHEINIVYGLTSSEKNYNFSVVETGNFTRLCVYPNRLELIGNMLLVYTNDTTSYTFNTINTVFNNETKEFKNYISGGSTETTFTVIDDTDIPLQNYLIKIEEFNVGTNSYLTHEILKTDSIGQAVGHIILGSKYYRFIVSDDSGDVVLTEPDTQGEQLYSPTKTFTITTGEDIWFTSFDKTLNTYTNLSFNNDTDSFIFTWDSIDGSSRTGCLRIDEFNTSGQITMFDSCSATSAGTIVGTITPKSDSRFFAQGYFKYNPTFVQETLEKIYQASYSFIDKNSQESGYMAFVLVLSFALLGIPFPMISFSLMALGLFIVTITGLFVMSPSFIVAIVIIGFIHGYRAFKGK